MTVHYLPTACHTCDKHKPDSCHHWRNILHQRTCTKEAENITYPSSTNMYDGSWKHYISFINEHVRRKLKTLHTQKYQHNQKTICYLSEKQQGQDRTLSIQLCLIPHYNTCLPDTQQTVYHVDTEFWCFQPPIELRCNIELPWTRWLLHLRINEQ